MRIFGLTGPIASGKSTAARRLEALGAHVIDADRIAREVVEPGGEAYEAVIKEFGPEILYPDGRIDRERLGSRVFSDPERRRRLESLTHPAIGARIARELARADQESCPIAVIEAILILQSPLRSMLEGVLGIDAPEPLRRMRLAERNTLSPQEVDQRLETQRPLTASFSQADWTLVNDGDRSHLERAIDGWWRHVVRREG